jgi:SAM-dependent methyltransferase
MEIVYQSNVASSRDRLLSYLRRLKAANPKMKILDIGGAFDPWTISVTDAFVDMFSIDGADVIQGDIHDPPLWDDIRRRGFDFCICSHLLEDIRDPIFVLRQIARTFRHGYIAMPNKHVEFSHIESKRYVGYCHHRWIFTLADGELRLVAKFPFASHFSPRYRGLAKIKASAPAKALRRLIHRTPRLSDIGPLPWWDARLADRHNELAFIWSGDLRFCILNDDFAGRTTYDTAILYRDELREGL